MKRSPIRKVSKKKAAYRASAEGQAGLAYMAAVKCLPCVICNAPPPSDAHHCFHGRYGAQKSSDFDTIPMCRWDHLDGPYAIHKNKKAWAEKHGPDYSYIPQVRAMIGGRQ